MKAVDTNVVLRFLLGDDPDQGAAARECIAGGVFVSHSVLIETEWVLRSPGWPREKVNRAFADFVALESVEVARIDELQWALDRHRQGADWADMLHLIAASGHECFASFEKDLAKQAGPAVPVPVERLK